MNAETAFSELARRLGLSYRPGPVPGRGGELNGILRAHRVLLRPERPALYVEYRFRVEGLRLSTARPRTGPAGGFASDPASGRDFDRAFPLRSAPGAAGEALRGARAFHAAALALLRVGKRRIARVDFERGQLVVTLRTRGLLRRRAALTPAEAEALLPPMLDAVEALEAALRAHAVAVATGGTATTDGHR
jgi:hypothetical protein